MDAQNHPDLQLILDTLKPFKEYPDSPKVDYIHDQLRALTLQDFEKELKWERSMQERGLIRYRRSADALKEKNSEGNSSYGLALIKHSLDSVQKAIEDYRAKALSGKVGPKATAAKLLKDLDLSVVSFLALRKLIDTISRPQPLQNTALAVANEIMFEVKLQAFKEADKARWNTTIDYLKESVGRTYRRNVLSYALSKSTHVSFKPWPSNERLQLGIRLIELICEATGLFHIEQDAPKGNKQGYYRVHATAKVTDWITHHNAHAEVLSPDYYPTLIPPKPWMSVYEGGYWFPHPDVSMPLIKSRDTGYLRHIDNLLLDGKLEEVRQAVNALQATPWKVNKAVLEVAQAVWNGPVARAGLPPHDPEHLPLCPVCGADITATASALIKHPCLEELKTSEDDAKKEQFKEWKRAAKEIREHNVELQGQRIAVAKTLKIASSMSRHDRFFFPHQLDFRGRVYAIPPFLSPQGTDLAKGLLSFAEGKALGSMEAVRWLGIHLANCYGSGIHGKKIDKTSLTDRFDWTVRNQAKILEVAEDPFEHDWWMDTDSPFCFLSACFEWAGYVREGLSYVSHLPIAMDGSCNGLQLFSLILRDEIGGNAVNLVPQNKPQDIYGIVAEKVLNRLKEDAADKSLDVNVVNGTGKLTFNRHKDAQVLLSLPIDRKTTKRQVMVLPYGGTMQSCIEYTKEWLEGQGIWNKKSYKFSLYSIALARYIWEEIGTTVIKARQAMDYLQAVAKAVAKLDKPIYWTTPCGLPIKQAYRRYDTERIRTLIGDSVILIRSPKEAAGYNKVKQSNSMSPNFIHSFDAAALQRTVFSCMAQGIRSYAMIHDSYGTHAADAATLARTLRQTFVEMFDGVDTLADFEHRLLRQLADDGLRKEDLPKRPSFGKLDIQEVMKSDYFFA